MESKGRLIDAVVTDRNTVAVTFEVKDIMCESIAPLINKDLDIKAVVHREKRSLNANAYFHTLVGKIADVMVISKTEAKNKLICEYGQVERDDNNNLQEIILKDSIDYLKIEWLHLKPTTHTKVLDNNELYRVYLQMRGSHTYDTKEMSILIEGTVNQAKELGIETLTPEELKRMVGECQSQ